MSDIGGIRRVGGNSDYDDSQSMLSINRYDNSDAGTVVNGGDQNSSFAMTEIRGGSQNEYNGSEYSSGNVIVVGDANSSYLGSETSIKLLGSN